MSKYKITGIIYREREREREEEENKCVYIYIIYDLVPKGAQEKRTEILENKVDRM